MGEDAQKSDFMHQLVNGLSIQINKYRCGKDYDHFKFVKSIYPTDNKEDLNNALQQARARYPIDVGIFRGTSLCLTNTCRVTVNNYMNNILKPHDHSTIEPTINLRVAKTAQNCENGKALYV